MWDMEEEGKESICPSFQQKWQNKTLKARETK